MASNEGLDMRICFFGLLLGPVLLLAQSPIGRTGEVTVSSVDVTSTSSISSEHLTKITQEIQSHSYAPSQSEEIVERARYTLQREGYFRADVSLNDVRTLSPIGGTIAVTLAIEEGRQYQLNQIRCTSLLHSRSIEA
jgi:outer membrane protein assembly factor BamA